MLFGGKSTATKKRKAVWEESTETDRNLELSHGSGGGLKVGGGGYSQDNPACVHGIRGGGGGGVAVG